MPCRHGHAQQAPQTRPTPDPDADPPAHPRWFDLDNFHGAARLSHWAARSDDLGADLARAPDGAGAPMTLERGELRWRMAVTSDGRLPFGGAFPALMAWECDVHPADLLPDSGCRLRRLHLTHPAPDDLRSALAELADDPRIGITGGADRGLHAIIETPGGERVLS